MRGHITQRTKDNKTWSVVIELNKINGKRKQKWYTVHGDKKDAEKFLTEKLRELDTGMFIDIISITVSDYFKYWVEECCIPNQSPTTYESYQKNINLHINPIIGDIKLKDLLPLHLQTLYSNRLKFGLSKTTVLYLHRIIHSALEQAMKWQLIPRNIADNVEPPKRNKFVAQVLDSSQITELIKIAKETDIYIPIMIAISTGMRRGEILGLTWDNVDFNNNTIKIIKALYNTKNGLVFLEPKTIKSKRIINIPPTLCNILKEHKQKQEFLKNALQNEYKDNNLVCCIENGSPFNPDSFTPKFRKLLDSSNLPKIRFHDLRHSHASLLLSQGVQPKFISERLGHSNINITMDLYSHIYEATNKEIANNFDIFLKTS